MLIFQVPRAGCVVAVHKYRFVSPDTVTKFPDTGCVVVIMNNDFVPSHMSQHCVAPLFWFRFVRIKKSLFWIILSLRKYANIFVAEKCNAYLR